MIRFLLILFLGTVYLAGLQGDASAQRRGGKTKCVPNPLYDYPNAARTGKCLKKPPDIKSNRGALSDQQKKAVDKLQREQERRILEIRQRTKALLDEQQKRNRTITGRRRP